MTAKDLKAGDVFRTSEKVFYIRHGKLGPGDTDLRFKGIEVDKETRERYVKAELAHVGGTFVRVEIDAKVRKV